MPDYEDMILAFQDDVLHEKYEDGLLQDAVICQIYVNRIVFDLNEKQQKGEDDAEIH